MDHAEDGRPEPVTAPQNERTGKDTAEDKKTARGSGVTEEERQTKPQPRQVTSDGAAATEDPDPDPAVVAVGRALDPEVSNATTMTDAKGPDPEAPTTTAPDGDPGAVPSSAAASTAAVPQSARRRQASLRLWSL